MSCLAILNEAIEIHLAGHALKARRIPVLKLLALAEAHVLEREREVMRANLELIPESERVKYVSDRMDKLSGEALTDKARWMLSKDEDGKGHAPDELLCQVLYTAVLKDQPDVTLDEIRCVFDDASIEELLEAVGLITGAKKSPS